MNQPLAETIFWIAALACAVAEIAILRSTFATRHGTPAKSGLVPVSSRGAELAWAVIPAVALCAVLALTWKQIGARGSHMQTMNHSDMKSMEMPSTQPGLRHP